MAKKWDKINEDDMLRFICICFISAIQKRKDKSSNWFSNDPILENPIMKRIMNGKKFHNIIRYLHVCSLKEQPSMDQPDYSPGYKVKEFKDLTPPKVVE